MFLHAHVARLVKYSIEAGIITTHSSVCSAATPEFIGFLHSLWKTNQDLSSVAFTATLRA